MLYRVGRPLVSVTQAVADPGMRMPVRTTSAHAVLQIVTVRLGMAALLLVLKVAVTSGSLRAGASGGLLTPGIAIGALLAVVLGSVWNLVWPDAPPGAYAVVGAAAFLAASMRMPLTAIVLILEFTRVDQIFLVPIILAVAGSAATQQLCVARAAAASAPPRPL